MARTERPRLTPEQLRQLFLEPRSAPELIRGLRALGFDAKAVGHATGASADTVYAWSAGRTLPSIEQVKALDLLRAIVSWMLHQEALGPASIWMVLNGWPGKLKAGGPTALDLIATGDWDQVIAAILSFADPAPADETGSEAQEFDLEALTKDERSNGTPRPGHSESGKRQKRHRRR
jgi:hypothetical protein